MGLYDDDMASVTSGDVLDVIYWQTKYGFNMLEAALKSKQDEGEIRMLVASVINGCNDVLKTYPNHADVKAWLDKATMIQGKVDPNSRPGGWRGDFTAWGEQGYEMGWRAAHIASMAVAIQDWDKAKGFGRDAVTYLIRAKDRMANWSADAKAYVEKTLPEMEKLVAEANKH